MAKDISSTQLLVLSQFLDDPDYKAYPARIESDLPSVSSSSTARHYVTRVSAKKICEKFEEVGVLTHTMAPTRRRQERSKYYHVNESREAFIRFSDYVFKNPSIWLNGLLMGTEYAGLQLNRQFVIETLNEKGIEFKIPFVDLQQIWEYRIFPDVIVHKPEVPSPKAILTLPVVGTYSKVFEDPQSIQRTIPPSEFRYMYLPNHFTRGKRTISPMDLNKYYNRVIERPKSYFPFRMESKWSGVVLTDEDFTRIEEMNMGKIDIVSSRDWLLSYYGEFQEEQVILPILCLIQISPSALKEFLFGDWADREYKTRSRGSVTEPIEGLLFRMVFEAAGDVARDRAVLDSRFSLAEHVVFGNPEDPTNSSRSLMTIVFKDFRRLCC